MNRNAHEPRIFVLWSHLPYYAFACLRSTAERLTDRIDVISIGTGPNGPLGHESVNVEVVPADAGLMRYAATARRLRNRDYDVVLVGGWAHSAMLCLAAIARSVGTMTVCMADTPWKSQARQIARLASARLVLPRLFNAIWIPGERGLAMAQMLGFAQERIWTGVYSTDQDLFGRGADERIEERCRQRVWPKRFVFVGRLAEEKNVLRLLDGYRAYRAQAKNAWDLVLVGDGPLRTQLGEQPGVRITGWLRPEEVAEEMRQGGAFVLPSTFEPWGVVVHEATCMGLPILCSTMVGAGADLVRHRTNGFVFNPFDVGSIADSFARMEEVTAPWELARASRLLSRSRSTVAWAETLVDGFAAWRSHH